MTICRITGYACDCQPDEGIPCDGLRKLRDACESWKKQSIERGQQIQQLRGELSLAEEGLANYAQENQQLKRALNFWLPMIPENAPLEENACLSRIERDAQLLFKFEGESDAQCAAEMGWVTLHLHPSEEPDTK